MAMRTRFEQDAYQASLSQMNNLQKRHGQSISGQKRPVSGSDIISTKAYQEHNNLRKSAGQWPVVSQQQSGPQAYQSVGAMSSKSRSRSNNNQHGGSQNGSSVAGGSQFFSVAVTETQ